MSPKVKRGFNGAVYFEMDRKNLIKTQCKRKDHEIYVLIQGVLIDLSHFGVQIINALRNEVSILQELGI